MNILAWNYDGNGGPKSQTIPVYKDQFTSVVCSNCWAALSLRADCVLQVANNYRLFDFRASSCMPFN
jgi:hypothetical protein